MKKIQNFTDLNAWQEIHQLALEIYQATKDFPRSELFGLTSQMRRCAVSIPSNIAEGFNRVSKKEKIQFYSIAMGSAGELLSQLLLTRDLKYLGRDKQSHLAERTEIVRKLTTGLIKSIRD